MKSCAGADVLHRFVAGTASRCECREVVRHLLGGCGACASLLRAAVQPPVEEGAYDVALARLVTWARALEPAEVGRP